MQRLENFENAARNRKETIADYTALNNRNKRWALMPILAALASYFGTGVVLTGSYVIGSAISTYYDEKIRADKAIETMTMLEERIQSVCKLYNTGCNIKL